MPFLQWPLLLPPQISSAEPTIPSKVPAIAHSGLFFLQRTFRCILNEFARSGPLLQYPPPQVEVARKARRIHCGLRFEGGVAGTAGPSGLNNQHSSPCVSYTSRDQRGTCNTRLLPKGVKMPSCTLIGSRWSQKWPSTYSTRHHKTQPGAQPFSQIPHQTIILGRWTTG